MDRGLELERLLREREDMDNGVIKSFDTIKDLVLNYHKDLYNLCFLLFNPRS